MMKQSFSSEIDRSGKSTAMIPCTQSVYGFATAQVPRRSWRRRHADRDQRRIGRICLDAARHLAFADIRRRISRRPAIGAHQHLIAAARSRAAADQAVEVDDTDSRARRTLLALRPGRTGRPDRPWRTHRAGIALRSGRTLGAGTLTLAASGKPEQQKPHDYQTSATHFSPTRCLGRGPRRPT